MNPFQLFFGLIIGIVAIFAFNQRNQQEEDLNIQRIKPGRKTVLVEPLMLPTILAVLIVTLIILGGASLMGTILAKLGLLFLYISIYYLALLCLLPLFRRIISARACATLWLIPNLLYFTIYSTYSETTPFFVISLPGHLLFVFAWIWVGGFASLLIWEMVSHLKYRSFLLKSAEAFTDYSVLSLWDNQTRRHGVKSEIPVLISEHVSTPLTIGCFDRTMRLILPKQTYTKEEFALIFQHELRHILRADTRTKVFLSFCTAMCWFNPFAWIARKKASDDLELSCDEAVLANADESTRKRYAELLLKSAGSGRGFTTCLSPAASSLRYRLRNVVNPSKRFSGGIVVGIALFALIMSLGTVALVDSGGTVQTLIMDKAPAEISIDTITTYRYSDDRFGYSSVYGWNEEALTDYITSLNVKQVYAGNYTGEGLRKLYVDYGESIDGEIVSLTRFELCDGLLFANIPYDDYGQLTFILEDDIDWGYIDTLLDLDTENPNPPPFPPDMMMYFNADINKDGNLMYASKNILSIKRGGVEQEVNEHQNREGVGGISGYPATQVKLHFSYLPQGTYEVQVENWERTESYTISSDELTEDVLPLAPYSAHYTVSGIFATVRDTVYEMEFFFDIELPK